MRDTFERLDDKLIDGVFQPLADRIADHLPFDCFQQARACTSLSAIAWILSQGSIMAAATRSGSVPQQAFHAALLLLGLAAIMVLHTLFQHAGGAGRAQGRANPLRVTMYFHRLVILSGLTVSIVKATLGVGSLALLAVAFFATAAVYVGACSNPPPSRRQPLADSWGRRLATLPRQVNHVPTRP